MLEPNLDTFFVKHDVELAPASHHHTRAGWINLDCPFCSPGSKRFRLGFKVKQRYFNCWSCGPVGFRRTLYALFRDDAKYFEAELGDLVLPKEDKIVGHYKEPPGLLTEMPKGHYDYLRERFGKETSINIERYKLQAIGRKGAEYAFRIFIPAYYKGKKATWTTRTIDPENEIRYKNAPVTHEAISIKHLLFGEDFLRHSVIVVEGQIDAMRIGPGAVSLGGVNFSQAQVLKLSRYPYRYICLDNDPPGRKAAESLASQLAIYPGTTQILTLDAKDPGQAKLSEIRKLRELL